MFQAAQIISLFSISFVLLSTCTFMVNIYISQYFQTILHIIMIWQSIKINCNLISFVIFIAHCHQNMPFSLSNPNILKPYMLILRWKRSLRMSLRKVFSRSTLAGTTWTWNSPGTWRGRKWHCWRRFRLPRKAWTGYISFLSLRLLTQSLSVSSLLSTWRGFSYLQTRKSSSRTEWTW